LDGYSKLLSRPQLVGKLTFNCLVGLKESHMVQFVHGLKVHEMQDQLATGANPHLLTMIKFCYNVKKRKVI
jgi:thymidine kinase